MSAIDLITRRFLPASVHDSLILRDGNACEYGSELSVDFINLSLSVSEVIQVLDHLLVSFKRATG